MHSKARKILIWSAATFIAMLIIAYFTWSLIFVFYLKSLENNEYLDIKPHIVNHKTNVNIANPTDLGIIKYNIEPKRLIHTEIFEDSSLKIEYENYVLIILKWENIESTRELHFGTFFDVFNTTTKDIKILKSPSYNSGVIIKLLLKSVSLITNNINVIKSDKINFISYIIDDNDESRIIITAYDNNNIYSQTFMILPKNNKVNISKLHEKFFSSFTSSTISENFGNQFEEIEKKLCIKNMIDPQHNIKRFISVFSEKTEELTNEFELKGFNLREFQKEFCVKNQSNPMFDSYQIHRKNINFLKNYLAHEPEWDFENYSYFIETESL